MENTKKILAAATLGVMVGAGLAVLFAPGKGIEIRRKFMSRKPRIRYEEYEADFYDEVDDLKEIKKDPGFVKNKPEFSQSSL